jgi:Zn-dependent peptidase ImmA (M78 family)
MQMAKAKNEHMSEARAQDIAELAEEVSLTRFTDGHVNPASIIEECGITLSFNDYGNAFDGMLEHRLGRFHVYINLARVGDRDGPRARFTLGHELGHYFIDEHRRALESGKSPAHKSICEYRSGAIVEQEADHFASNLLLPQSRFVSRAKKHAVGLLAILKLAEYFKTSVTSTAIRYASLGISPCAVIKWDDLAFGWKWLSRDTFEARLFKTIESIEQLPHDCPTARALRGEIPVSRFFEAATTAAAWYKSVAPDGARNAILMEQAMALGQYGVITFLYPLEGKYSSGA